MAGKFNLDKPNPLWKHRPKFAKRGGYGSKESEQVILHLHTIEQKLRAEIEREQVVLWSPEQIRARFG